MVGYSIRRAFTSAACLVVSAALLSPAAAAAPESPLAGGTWVATGSLSVARERAAGLLLNSGKVLMTGGETCVVADCTVKRTAELYDPVNGTWSSTGSMSERRSDLRAVLLANGKALAIGGTNGSGNTTAELYNPATNSWSSGGSFLIPRDSGFQAVVMPSGKVLVVGGCCLDPGPYTSSAEIYDPATNTWSQAANMSSARNAPIAVLLATGKVLVAGGVNNNFKDLATAELYDPDSNTWSPAGSMSDERRYAEAALTPSGSVLVVGGYGPDCLGTSEEYNPATNSWGSYRTGLVPRSDLTATPIMVNSGRLLVAGGNCSLQTSSLYDSAAHMWSNGPDLLAGRRDHVTVRLRSGQVLAAGGKSRSSAELFTPVSAATAYAGPNPAKKGALVTITGAGFLAGEMVQLAYRGVVFASAVATASGTFSVGVDTTNAGARNYIDTARGVTSGRTAYFQLLVTTG